MSIESDFRQISIHLSRVADALEAILAERGYVPTGPTSVTLNAEGQPVTKVEASDAVSSSEEKPTQKTRKKKKSKKEKVTVVGKPESDEPSEFTIQDVRKVLKTLQEAKNQASVKSLLKKYGSSTLAQVKEKHYVDIIRDAEEDME